MNMHLSMIAFFCIRHNPHNPHKDSRTINPMYKVNIRYVGQNSPFGYFHFDHFGYFPLELCRSSQPKQLTSIPFKISSSVVAAIYLLDLLSKIDTYIVIFYKLYFFSLLGTIFVNLYLTVTYSVIIQIQGPFVSLFKIMDLL